MTQDLAAFLASVHPYNAIDAAALDNFLPAFRTRSYAAGAAIYDFGEPLEGLYLIRSGAVEITDGVITAVTEGDRGPRSRGGLRSRPSGEHPVGHLRPAK